MARERRLCWSCRGRLDHRKPVVKAVTMKIVPPKISGVEKVLNIFGYWPSFHDAEIKWLRLDRTAPNGAIGPMLEIGLHCFEMTSEVAPSGHYVLQKHTLLHFRFLEVTDLRIEDFNRQNSVFGLEIVDESGPGWESPFFSITIDPSFGIGGSFHSACPEIVSAIPCDERGEETTL